MEAKRQPEISQERKAIINKCITACGILGAIQDARTPQDITDLRGRLPQLRETFATQGLTREEIDWVIDLIEKSINKVEANIRQPAPLPAANVGSRAETVLELSDPETEALEGYKKQFDSLQAGNKPEWSVVRRRLLANGKNKLKLAMELEETVIFGVDARGEVLFSDGGNEVPECTNGKNYFDTMTAIQGKYELFNEKLMGQWETATKKDFVRDTWSWLKSEDLLPSYARSAFFVTFLDEVNVFEGNNPEACDSYRGARRLLRV